MAYVVELGDQILYQKLYTGQQSITAMTAKNLRFQMWTTLTRSDPANHIDSLRHVSSLLESETVLLTSGPEILSEEKLFVHLQTPQAQDHLLLFIFLRN